jgi:predicted Rossmann fold nucleotide-binding protein DprA/Smf involved in DNA uptake
MRRREFVVGFRKISHLIREAEASAAPAPRPGAKPRGRQRQVLAALGPTPMRSADVQRALGISSGNASKLLANLVLAGWASRSGFYYSVTDAGRAALAKGEGER